MTKINIGDLAKRSQASTDESSAEYAHIRQGRIQDKTHVKQDKECIFSSVKNTVYQGDVK